MVGRSDGLRATRGVLLAFFFVSGLTALLYQTVWMRLAMAAFGVNTSIAATVLSVFMLGLAAGTAAAVPLVVAAQRRHGWGPLRVYGAAEFAVGLGGLAVPALLTTGRGALLSLGPAGGIPYTAASAAILGAILFPFCTAMGLTLPCAIAFLRGAGATGKGRLPFSALYLANVVGALVGAVVTPLFLIEKLGFLATSRIAVAGNGAIAATALLAWRGVRHVPQDSESRAPTLDPDARARDAALFATGFSTMGMEVVWMRIYPTIIGTFVYSFAAIVAIYLLMTTVGSAIYRRVREREGAGRLDVWLPWLGAASLLPLLSASTSFPPIDGVVRVFLGLAPFCAILGLLTPALVDRQAGDDPARVARAYGVNLLGCLAGPLVAGFVLIPATGTRTAAIVLALPLFLVALASRRRGRGWRAAAAAFLAVSAAIAICSSATLFEESFPAAQVRRDHVATVVAAGEGMNRILYVNGVGMTVLTPVTKMMAHFPAAHLAPEGRPLDALVICFGMGTTFRSLASWRANVTAVELVPSVTELFGYFHPDGPGLVAASGGRLRIVHDDGRRFLDRSRASFDLITIDPPPPVEAAGSSLLYSKEFYAAAKRKLRPGGILQTWLPGGDKETVGGFILSLLESFPSVRVMRSIDGTGFHVSASMTPIPRLPASALVARMPAAAVRDMREWLDAPPERFFQFMLDNEFVPESLLVDGSRAATVAISDDRPVNEFFFARRRRSVDAPGATAAGKAPQAEAARR
jgi:spermidine synthase